MIYKMVTNKVTITIGVGSKIPEKIESIETAEKEYHDFATKNQSDIFNYSFHCLCGKKNFFEFNNFVFYRQIIILSKEIKWNLPG